jgi:hypothetical protein
MKKSEGIFRENMEREKKQQQRQFPEDEVELKIKYKRNRRNSFNFGSRSPLKAFVFQHMVEEPVTRGISSCQWGGELEMGGGNVGLYGSVIGPDGRDINVPITLTNTQEAVKLEEVKPTASESTQSSDPTPPSPQPYQAIKPSAGRRWNDDDDEVLSRLRNMNVQGLSKTCH